MWKAIATGIGAALVVAPLVAQAKPKLFELRAELTIGSVDERDYSLTQIGGLAIGRDGTLFLLQPQEGVVKVFDKNGKAKGAIGRKGAGPGEFERLGALGLIGDTLWVTDPALARISLFLQTGQFLTSLDLSGVRWNSFRVIPRGLLPGRLVVAGVSVPTSALSLDEAPLLLVSGAHEVIDTLAWLSRAHSTMAFWDSDNSHGMFATQPISDHSLYVLRPGGSGIVIVERPSAHSEVGYITIRNMDHTKSNERVQKVPYAASTLPEAVADSLVEIWAQRVFSSPRLGIGSLNDARRRARAQLYLPKYLPPVTDVLVAPDSSIWLRREDIGKHRPEYMIIGSRGQAVGTVRGPARVLGLERDRLWAVEYDAYDIPRLVKYRITGVR